MRYLHKYKSSKFRSRECGGHKSRSSLPIDLVGYVILRNFLSDRLKCNGALSCMNHIRFFVVDRMPSNNSDSSFLKKTRYICPLKVDVRKNRSIMGSLMIPAQIFLLNQFWWMCCVIVCELSKSIFVVAVKIYNSFSSELAFISKKYGTGFQINQKLIITSTQKHIFH